MEHDDRAEDDRKHRRRDHQKRTPHTGVSHVGVRFELIHAGDDEEYAVYHRDHSKQSHYPVGEGDADQPDYEGDDADDDIERTRVAAALFGDKIAHKKDETVYKRQYAEADNDRAGELLGLDKEKNSDGDLEKNEDDDGKM